jgi:hypothetical protein
MAQLPSGAMEVLGDQNPRTGSSVRAHELKLSLKVHYQEESHALSGADPGPAGFDFALRDDEPGTEPLRLQFHRAVEEIEIWSASNSGFSFVITYESPVGPGFHGRPGYVAVNGAPFIRAVERFRSADRLLKRSQRPRKLATSC